MYNWILQQLSAGLKIPPQPEPPFGAPGSVRIFRAGKNYYKMRLAAWAVAETAALAAIVFWAFMLIEVEAKVHEQRAARGQLPALTAQSFAEGVTKMVANDDDPPASAPAPAPVDAAVPATAATTTMPSTTPASTATVTPAPEGAAKAETAPAKAKKKKYKFHYYGFTRWFAGLEQSLVEFGLRLPPWAFVLIWVLKIVGFVVYLVQIPFTYVMRRLDYEMRWYIVTDRSLRIRAGIVRLQESTMSFANLQQVEVKQNPIQRLLGLADVHVQSAGGGGNHEPGEEHHDSLHNGIFHSVENATEIRDLILERLRLFRQAGLGDPDDHHDHAAVGGGTPLSRETTPATSDALAAAREVLAEARSLRQAL